MAQSRRSIPSAARGDQPRPTPAAAGQVGGTIAGTFERITFPNIAPGFDADITVTADGDLRLTARSDAVPLCAGDCDSSGAVTVNEVITLVNVALGTGPLAHCEVGDGNGDRQITIDELIIAVMNALAGCLSDH